MLPTAHTRKGKPDLFDEVTRRTSGRDAVKRAGFVFGSTVLHVGVLAAVVAISAALRSKVVEPKQVEVKFFKTLSPAPPAPPPPAAPPPAAPKKPAEPHRPEPKKTSPTQALVQPREILPHGRVPQARDGRGGLRTAFVARPRGVMDRLFAGGSQVRPAAWPHVKAATSVSGLVGSALTFGVAVLLGASIRRSRRR